LTRRPRKPGRTGRRWYAAPTACGSRAR
jgi:hypothetical protein